MIVLVGGAPGAGKTTLATALAARLGLPLVSKDAIKESMMDALGAPDVASSQRIGRAAWAVLWTVAHAIVAGGGGVVVESNFHREMAADALRTLADRGHAVFVHCTAPTDIIRERYATRVRHPGHRDQEHLAAWDEDVSIFEPPLGIRGIRAIHIDTSAPVDAGALAREIRTAAR